MLLIFYWYKSIWKVLSLLYIRHITLFNQSKYVQIKSCDLVKICIYTLCPSPHHPPHQIPFCTHAITYSCSTQLCSWTAWQRAVLSCYLFHHWYKCWFYIQYLLQTPFITFQIYWWPSTEAFTCQHPICYSPYHFSEGWKCCWGH